MWGTLASPLGPSSCPLTWLQHCFGGTQYPGGGSWGMNDPLLPEQSTRADRQLSKQEHGGETVNLPIISPRHVQTTNTGTAR